MAERTMKLGRGGDGAPPSSGAQARAWGAGIVAVAATYVYFLLFAQFALLALATQAGEAAALRALMGAMGAGGLVGAAVAAGRHDATRVRSWLLAEFVLCALAAQLATLASGRAAWFGVFALVGWALGALTVTLAANLRAALGAARLGLGIGLGTGVAYALCNVPFVFTAEPRTQAWFAAAAALAGAMAAMRLTAGGESAAPVSRGGLARWVVALTALVWMDSAVFYVIQQTPELRAQTWVGEGKLWANALVHLVAGVAAGAALDAGWRRAPVVAGMALLAAASLMLAGVLPASGPGWLYVAGVSFYSVALVHVPASTGRASVAAVIYGVAGWIGSALGIGMAQDLARVPVGFVALAAVAVVVALGGKRAATLAVVALGLFGATRGAAADELVLRGREVYIREGCIHCHSQYVRPHAALDVERWGPATDLAKLLEQKPPLPGNRRQGPDLANVGNRRSAEWNRLHLRAPRVVSPGSRMPSYAHLFDGRDDSDGEALVAYLASLGAETMAERLTQIAAWRPARAVLPDEARARRLFAKLCVGCHGPNGRGDGALAAQLSVRPPDWTREGWRRVPGGAEVEEALARIIKFGVPGTPMAGHEYLPDEDVVGLARAVLELRR
jgi:cytochrome c oxidase cbb3-type subunit 2